MAGNRRAFDEATLNKTISELIEEITPLNNAYRGAVRSRGANGAQVLEIMWDVGEVLIGAGVEKVHPVAWEIYGRTRETRRSYITRDFISYCFRIRRYFSRRGDIRKNYPGLRRYSLFREAFPLLENRKYALDAAEKKRLLALLNSNDDPGRIKREIQAMKRARIGITNDRRQKLEELEKASREVMARHAELLEINSAMDTRKIRAIRRRVGEDNLSTLSKYCLSLFSEDFPVPDGLGGDTELKGAWSDFYAALNAAVESGLIVRNRMRRLVRPVTFMELAEMLGAARTGSFVQEQN